MKNKQTTRGRPRKPARKKLVRIAGSVSESLHESILYYMDCNSIVSESQAVRELVTKGLGVGR